MKARHLLAAIIVAGLFQSIPASAQPATSSPRVFFYVGAGLQLREQTFTNGSTFRVNAEDARFDADYETGGDLFFKVNGGYLFTRHFGAGAGVTHFSTPTDAVVTASIPHPFFFRKPRTIQGTATGLDRQQQSVDVHLLATTTLGRRLQLTIFGGPSFFKVRQDVATSATFTEVYPYDEATFEGVTTMSGEESATGFNAGGNVVFLITSQLGFGADIQFSGASVELSDGTATPVTVDAGGVQVTAGLRLSF